MACASTQSPFLELPSLVADLTNLLRSRFVLVLRCFGATLQHHTSLPNYIKLDPVPKRNWWEYFSAASKDATTLIRALMAFDPNKRISAKAVSPRALLSFFLPSSFLPALAHLPLSRSAHVARIARSLCRPSSPPTSPPRPTPPHRRNCRYQRQGRR